MRIAVCSDEPYGIHEQLLGALRELGHEVVAFGSIRSGGEEPWAAVAAEAAESILRGDCDEGIFCCWTGTGIAMAANKLPGIRAALCTDAETARGARIWNHANVLALSNRLLGEHVLTEILEAWFGTDPGDAGAEGVAALAALDDRHRGG
jgi:ribose 5-phosphate isomerase B